MTDDESPEIKQADHSAPDDSGSWPPVVASPEITEPKKENRRSFLWFLLCCIIVPVPYLVVSAGIIFISEACSGSLIPDSGLTLVVPAVVLASPIVFCSLITWRFPNTRRLLFGVIAGMIIGPALIGIIALCSILLR
jgi:uncharacterized membrane protein YhaH (DUF805 family)